MPEEKQNIPLQNDVIQITGIDLVDQGKEGNTWKAYRVKVNNWKKGEQYSIPLKTAKGTSTVAYEYYRERMSRWSELFAENKVVKVKIGYSQKINNWEHKGKTGTSIYKTIRFLEEVGEDYREAEPTPPEPTEDELDVDSMPF